MLAKKKAAGGAPEWALTYGDMMSLLLCFFILLTAFANFDKSGGGGASSAMAAMQSIQAALGIKARETSVMNSAVTYNALIERIKKILQVYEEKNKGDVRQAGVQGKSFRLRRIHDGMEITIGGPVLFEPFAARMTEEGREALEGIGGIMKGHRNKVDIVGHAAEQPAPTDWTDGDALQLSYLRARCVADELIARGVDPRAIRVVAAGGNEPVRADSSNPASPGDNRRVEVVVRESMIDDYRGEKTARKTEASPTTVPAK